jgi:hypothetical protein
MNLAESSLAVEATHYDFTSSVTVQSTGFYNRIFGQPEKRKTVKTAESSPIPEVTIYFSELNKHDCMLPFVATIKKLAALQIQEVFKASSRITSCYLHCSIITSNSLI